MGPDIREQRRPVYCLHAAAGRDGFGDFYVARVLDGCIQIVDPPSAPSIVQKDAFAPGERMSVIAVGSGFKPPFGFYATYAAGGALLALGAAALLFKLVRGKK